MTWVLRAFGLVALVALVGAAGVIWTIERDLAQYRTALQHAEPYWSCAQLPADHVLARGYARRVMLQRGDAWHGWRWTLGYAAYTSYLGRRVPREELSRSFLRSPSHRERGCAVIVR